MAEGYEIIREPTTLTTAGALFIRKIGNIVQIACYTSTKLTTDGITIPEGYRPFGEMLFTGKAYKNGADTWTQPFRIDTNGVLTARSNDNNSAVEVTWWGFSIVYFAG